jgi:hypothetical protein
MSEFIHEGDAFVLAYISVVLPARLCLWEEHQDIAERSLVVSPKIIDPSGSEFSTAPVCIQWQQKDGLRMRTEESSSNTALPRRL